MPETNFDPEWARAQFPLLRPAPGTCAPICFDNPGGTQVPDRVIEQVVTYYRAANANVGGAFETSKATDRMLREAREAMAALLNAPDPDTIVFGANMTTLTFALARAFARSIRPGDEIVVTNLDHDANVTPWTDLQESGAVIKGVDIRPDDCTLEIAALENALSERTRVVAITHASNAVGTIPDVRAAIAAAHRVGALVFVDAVQYVPHGPVDVQALDCDFLACSAYKFFGPHVGVLYGKREHLERLTPYKVRPAKDTIPYRWETGTLNHEGIAGVLAAVRYLESLGSQFGNTRAASAAVTDPRIACQAAMRTIKQYEEGLSQHLIAGLRRIPDLRIYGITAASRVAERVPTVAFTWSRRSPRATAGYLAGKGISCWSGNYYALQLMERLGLEAEGGAVRIGLAHYNTIEEIDTLLEALESA